MTYPEWFLALCIACFFVFVLLCLRAPVGFEDSDGFHDGEPD
jgi:hypothetical protein